MAPSAAGLPAGRSDVWNRLLSHLPRAEKSEVERALTRLADVNRRLGTRDELPNDLDEAVATAHWLRNWLQVALIQLEASGGNWDRAMVIAFA